MLTQGSKQRGQKLTLPSVPLTRSFLSSTYNPQSEVISCSHVMHILSELYTIHGIAAASADNLAMCQTSFEPHMEARSTVRHSCICKITLLLLVATVRACAVIQTSFMVLFRPGINLQVYKLPGIVYTQYCDVQQVCALGADYVNNAADQEIL